MISYMIDCDCVLKVKGRSDEIHQCRLDSVMQHYTFFDLAEAVSSQLSAINFLQDRRLLKMLQICPECSLPMDLMPRGGRLPNVGYSWRCPNRNNRQNRCYIERSVLQGSMFVESNIDIRKIICLMYEWACRSPINVTAERLEIAEQTVGRYFQDFRNICTWKLLQEPIQLGGAGCIVEIDESMFARAKYNVGHAMYRPQQWIFAIYDTTSKQGYLRLVDQRNSETLIPIIQQVVRPGSVIFSDEWAAYSRLTQLPNPQPYCHFTVNHQNHYVDPVSQCTTNHVEAYWSRTKKIVKQQNGMKRHVISSYMDQQMWFDRYRKDISSGFINLLEHISEKFPL